MRALFAMMLLIGSSIGFAQDFQHQGRDDLAGGENGRAVESFAAAVNVNPFDAVALNNLAVARAAQGNYQTALMLLERAARLAPDRKDIADNLARFRSWLEGGGEKPFEVQVGAAPPDLPPLWSKK